MLVSKLSAAATADGTCPSSRSGASSTIHTPSGYADTAAATACRPSRVLPAPPTPVKVSRRDSASSWSSSLSSLVRPTVPAL